MSLTRARGLILLAVALGFGPAMAVPAPLSYPVGSWVMDSGWKGPMVLVVAGLHGDEKSGMEAAKTLIDKYGGGEGGRARGLARGMLVVVPVANQAAADSSARTGPSGLDMNRLFPGGSASEEAKVDYGIFVTAKRSNLVLDLHEEGLAWLEADRPTLVTNAAAAPLVMDLLEDLSGEGFAFTGGAPGGSLVAELDRAGRPAITVEIPARLPEPERKRLQLLVIDAALRRLGLLR